MTDRISVLPNEILGHILSKIPTKEAARLSCLSTKWVSISSYISALEFKLSDTKDSFSRTSQLMKMWDLRTIKALRLTITNEWLAIYLQNKAFEWEEESPIFTLSLNIKKEVADLLQDIKQLRFCLQPGGICWSLTALQWQIASLHLKNILLMAYTENWEVFHMGQLKVLVLEACSFDSQFCLQSLMLGCPLLEEFQSKDSDWNSIDFIDITSPSLRKLYLNLKTEHQNYRPKHPLRMRKLQIDCGALTEFVLYDYCSLQCSTVNCPCIERVEISSSFTHCEDYIMVMYGIFSARYIRLCFGFNTAKELMDGGIGIYWRLPTFDRLTELHMDFQEAHAHEFVHVLTSFLNASPLLKSLNISQGKWLQTSFKGRAKKSHMDSVKKVLESAPPICLRDSLSRVKVLHFHGHKEIMKQIAKFFIREARVMESFQVSGFNFDEETINELRLMTDLPL